ncbi:hypothetical protein [Mycobacteroides abscessus]|uniref:hypothetical protein n=1 Tax=Mycobacteroides abscessus TaxID=36809 RepID=UPI002648B061|nr:hypothetical protein [Mycobacteroides abscessus]MDO3357780.1 hypothetical protein [Mycobacteroides abscessus subsp. massiliense]WKE45649.1 hypothetical protein P3M63_07545 [Mycobacteroides abscessus subsp. massiliense]
MITHLMTAGLKGSGDGTSNGSLTALVDRIVMGSLTVSVGIFIVLLMLAAWVKQKGTGRFEAGGGRNGGNPIRAIVPPAAGFLVLTILLAGVWALVRVASGLSGGMFS